MFLVSRFVNVNTVRTGISGISSVLRPLCNTVPLSLINNPILSTVGCSTVLSSSFSTHTRKYEKNVWYIIISF